MAFKVRFTKDFNFTPRADRRRTTRYLAGRTYSDVSRDAAERAVAAGKGEILVDPLDHDANGIRGGSRPRGSRRARGGATTEAPQARAARVIAP